MTENTSQNKKSANSAVSIPAQKAKLPNVSGMENTDMTDEITQVVNLMKKGIISTEQGRTIIAGIASGQSVSASQDTAETQEADAEEENKSTDAGTYNELFDYLKDLNPSLSEDDYETISALLQNIEQNAVDKYEQQMRHQKNLNIRNESAKRRMTSVSQNAAFENNKNKVFTREEIGKMSREDFIKNEDAIMSQLRKGLIK